MDLAQNAVNNSRELRRFLKSVEDYDIAHHFPHIYELPDTPEYYANEAFHLQMLRTKTRLFELRHQLDNINVQLDRSNARCHISTVAVEKIQALLDRTPVNLPQYHQHVAILHEMKKNEGAQTEYSFKLFAKHERLYFEYIRIINSMYVDRPTLPPFRSYSGNKFQVITAFFELVLMQ